MKIKMMTTILMIVMTICGPRETCSMVRKAPVPDGFNDDDDDDDEKDDDDDENDDHLGESIPHEGGLQWLSGHPGLLGRSMVIIIMIINIIILIIIMIIIMIIITIMTLLA